MKAALRALLLLIMLSPAAPAPAAAQAVRGELRDADRGRPIAGARLLLLDSAGIGADTTVSDGAGRFRLAARGPGTYSVYFELDGWASTTSEQLVLAAGAVVELAFRVPLVSNEALREIGDIMGMEPRLQEALPEICGEAFRPWEAGLLVGRVRARATSGPVAGARVEAVQVAGRPPVRATVSSANGVYILCNVPVGASVPVITTTAQGAIDTTRVEIRAGTAAWYDLFVGAGRR